MNKSKKTFINGRAYAVSCLAVASAIGANILMFCILAVARTTPALTYPEQQEPMRIINLDLTVPTDVEPADMETVMEVIELGPEQTNEESLQPVAEMISQEFPLLTERISDLSFELPGLPVLSSNISLLTPPRAAPVGGSEKPASPPKVDHLPSKIAGPVPRYPQWARRDKLEATVTLRFIVTAEGTVEDVNINEIEGDERFGDEAIRAVSQWRFSPAIKAGKPVSCWCFQKINFEFNSHKGSQGGS
jgi:protein TonB